MLNDLWFVVSSKDKLFLDSWKKKEEDGVFVLWAVSFNYKVEYDKGNASVCMKKLRPVVKPSSSIWHAWEII